MLIAVVPDLEAGSWANRLDICFRIAEDLELSNE